MRLAGASPAAVGAHARRGPREALRSASLGPHGEGAEGCAAEEGGHGPGSLQVPRPLGLVSVPLLWRTRSQTPRFSLGPPLCGTQTSSLTGEARRR